MKWRRQKFMLNFLLKVPRMSYENFSCVTCDEGVAAI